MTIDRNNLNFSPKLIVWSFHNLSILTNDGAQNQKQAENGLFLQIKSARILDILWVLLIKQLFQSRWLDVR